MTNTNRDRNLVGAISYFLFFITGIVILMVEKDDRFIRFHAWQSTLVFGGLFIINILVGWILKPIPIVGLLATFLNAVIWIVTLVIWGVSMYQAYQGRVYKWPIVGKMAERNV